MEILKPESAPLEDARRRVFELERHMLAMPQIELEVKHYFANGVYARELHIPKGTVLTGRVHKFENLNILSKGDLSVLTEDGVKRIQAPCTIVSPPGTKRVAIAHEDCVWTTILATAETDPEAIEAAFTTNDEQEYLAFRESLKLQGD